jgi:hypothetical protein
MAWDAYMLPIIGEVGKLRKAAQTSDILIRWHRYKETIGKQAFVVLCPLMLRQTMVSYIPFENPKPIINIRPMYGTTELVTFMKSSGAGHIYINSVDGSYKGLRERFTGVASTQATAIGKTNTFGSGWWFIYLISVAFNLGPASMDPDISSSKQLGSLTSGVAHMGRPNLMMLRTVISEFAVKAYARVWPRRKEYQ